MIKFKLKIYKLIADIFRIKSKGYKILMYHSIDINVDKEEYYKVSFNNFRQQMEYIANNYKVKRLSEIKKNGSGIVVTFDDGYRDNLLYAVPVLEKLKIPYTIFISTKKIGKKEGTKEYLTVNDIRELSKLPFCNIGSHGHSHISLAGLSLDKLKRELEISKKILEEITFLKIFAISFPHGSFDEQALKAVYETGYTHGATSRFGSNKSNFDYLCLKRIDIWGYDTINIFRQKIEGNWDWLILKESLSPLVWLYRFIMKIGK